MYSAYESPFMKKVSHERFADGLRCYMACYDLDKTDSLMFDLLSYQNYN